MQKLSISFKPKINCMTIRESAFYLKTRLLNQLCYLSSSVRNFPAEDNILLFSSPRSGSTWLAELINTLPDTAMLWEPLHLLNVKEFRELGFGWRQHIPENEQWKEAEETFEKLFKGEFLNFWLSSREFPLKFCTAERMVIKFVRANGMLAWLTKTFKFKKAPVYLLRHPFAVAASQMKEGSWDDEFKGYEIPEVPFNKIYSEHISFLSSLKAKQEKMVANWCINNKIVLENSRNDKDWITLHYENLLLNPEEELQRIFNRWGLPMPDGILGRVRRASSTTKETIFQKDLEAQLSKWQPFFKVEEIERMQKVLDYFEIKVYSDKVLPIKE